MEEDQWVPGTHTPVTALLGRLSLFVIPRSNTATRIVDLDKRPIRRRPLIKVLLVADHSFVWGELATFEALLPPLLTGHSAFRTGEVDPLNVEATV